MYIAEDLMEHTMYQVSGIRDSESFLNWGTNSLKLLQRQ